MKNGILSAALLFVCSALFLTSCKEADQKFLNDEQDPKIFCSSPQVVAFGEYVSTLNATALPLDIRFEDDVELKNFRIEIIYRGDLVFLPIGKTQSDAWSKVIERELDGKSAGINETVSIMGDPYAGPYEFKITVWDMSGKATTLSTWLFMSNNRDTQVPVITLTNPDPNNPPTYSTGTNLTVQGIASDNVSIVRVTMWLRDLTTNEVVPNTTVIMDTLYNSLVTIDTFMTIPSIAPGNYNVEVFANDQVYNYGKKKAGVVIQ